MANFLSVIPGPHVVQGIIIGVVLGFLTANLLMNAAMRAQTTVVDGWGFTPVCGRPDNGLLLRAACARILPGVNSVEEAAYWTATVDGAGRALSGRQDYVLTFPAGGQPPCGAFWSLTLTDTAGFMVNNPAGRGGVGSLTGLVPNADGSVDIFIRRTAPAGKEPNWLPAPAGGFKLTLRAYLPGPAVLSGEYRVPPVRRAD